MFGPREVLLTSENPVITQFVNGRRMGPIGMSEEKDEATLAQERATLGNGEAEVGSPALMPQLVPSPGVPERQAVQRRMDRVMSILPTLPTAAQEAILTDLAIERGQQAAPASGAARDPERERAQAQARAEAWKLAREREAAQREAEQETAEQDGPGGWPPDWPGGGG
jgi:phospholipid/cholesterol/gamma-HCH transport system ATP-binding protein